MKSNLLKLPSVVNIIFCGGEKMQADIDKLITTLNLTEYQARVLRARHRQYDMTGLVKRGGVLYAPRNSSDGNGIIPRIRRALFGRRADLIGRNKMLLCATRRIKFMADGFHCVRIGQYQYWADKNGQSVSSEYVRRVLGQKYHR
mgnify:CR=1 FL=1